MPDTEPLRLSKNELFSPQVEGYLEEQAVLSRAMPEITPRPLLVRILYSSYFYMSTAGALGAVCAWGLLEPYLDDRVLSTQRSTGESAAWFLLFPLVAGFIGLFLGAAEGIMSRNLGRAAICALVGLGVGLAGGLVSYFIAGVIFFVMNVVAARISTPRENGMPTGLGLLALIMGRGAAWAIAALPAGIGQGLALREKKVVLNGLLGGVLGGLLGGLLFDPIGLLLSAESGEASRGVGFTVIGIMVGLFVGLVEQWTKTAWLLMRVGPLAGKQFVIYRNPTVIGSSPKADIYVFKDPAIEPRHALIHNRGGRFELEDCNTPDGTYVNGIPIKKHILKSGDQVVLGKTVLEFSLKDSK
jgi:hypothetical protein